jgi:hypothetical protein
MNFPVFVSEIRLDLNKIELLEFDKLYHYKLAFADIQNTDKQ